MYTGGYDYTGEEIVKKTFGCGSLPLSYNEIYKFRTIDGGLIHELEQRLLPKLEEYSIFKYAGITHLSALACFVNNCDTVALQLSPPVIPTAISPFLVMINGVAFSSIRNLVGHNASTIEVWDGSSFQEFQPMGNLWISTVWYISALHQRVSKYILAISPTVSIFGGLQKNSTTAFIIIDSVRINLFLLFPLLELGSGAGGIRLLSKGSKSEICTPSGIFGRVNLGLNFPIFGKIVEGYLDTNWFVFDNSVDIAIHFQKQKVGLKSFQMRALSNLVILNIPLSKIDLQIQYLSKEELSRRRELRLEINNCFCKLGYDNEGVCKDELEIVDQWIQDTTYHAFSGITISAEWNASFFWDLFAINNLRFIFATPIGIKGAKPFLILGGTIDILFLRNFGGYIEILHPRARTSLTAGVAQVFDIEIEATSNTTDIVSFKKTNDIQSPSKINYSDFSVLKNGSFSGLRWEFGLQIKISKGIKSIWSRISKSLHIVSQHVASLWQSIKQRIKNLRENFSHYFSESSLFQNHSSEAIFKRSLENEMKELHESLNESTEKNPLIAHILLGKNIPTLIFEKEDISLKILNKADIHQIIQIPIKIPHFKNERFEFLSHSLIQNINFGNMNDVQQGFENIKQQFLNYSQNGLSTGIESKYIDQVFEMKNNL